MTALFAHEGDEWIPSEFTRGPWRPDAQHGGPPSALLAHLTEPHVEEREFVSFIEIQLVRPVPLRPLRARSLRRRVSGRVARVESELIADDDVVARSEALVLRTAELDPPESPAASTRRPDAPDDLRPVEAPRWASGDVTTYHRNAVEHRFTEGSFRTPGPAVDWMRLRVDIVEGQSPTPLERVCAAADFGSGISAVYGPTSTFGLINANLAVSIHRELVGEWVALDAHTHVGPQGTGLGVTLLSDREGQIAIATQSLLGYRIDGSPFVTR